LPPTNPGMGIVAASSRAAAVRPGGLRGRTKTTRRREGSDASGCDDRGEERRGMPGSGRRKQDTRRAARGLRAGAARQKRRRQHMFEVHEGCMRRKTCEHEERREKMRPTGKRRRGQGERRTEATTGDGRRGGSEGVRHSYQLRPRSSRDTTSENGQWNAAIGAQGDITSGGERGRGVWRAEQNQL